jgi:hypothetical protein
MANNTGETGNTHWVGANAYVSFSSENLKRVNNFGDLEVDTRITMKECDRIDWNNLAHERVPWTVLAVR